MRLWAPRRPADQIKRRLFGTPSSTGPRSRPEWSPTWLVPAAACILLGLVMVRPDYDFRGMDVQPNATLAVTTSNRATAGEAPLPLESLRGDFPGATFEWTNYSRFTSSNTSFLPGKVN